MEKTIAELDATLVLNYIDDDAEIEIIETVETEQESTLDTSFDENQNPKLKSKTSTVEETPRQDKDLIVLLDNKVLTPRRLVSDIDEGHTNGFEPLKPDAFKETTCSQPLKFPVVENNGLRTKRARSEETKDLESPKTKKVKSKDTTVKDLDVKKLNSLAETKELEFPKRKRGRPKSIGTNKVASEVQTSKSKESKEDIFKTKDQDAVIETKDLVHSKPKRGRPKTLKSLADTKSLLSMPKNTSESSIQIKPKRGRPKGSGKVVASESKAKGMKNRGVESKLVNMTESQTSKTNKTSLEAEQQSATADSKDLGPSKPKKGRSKAKPLTVISLKKVKTTLEAKQQNTTAVVKDKPKRGRPKGFRIKKDDITIINKDLEHSKSEKEEISSVTKELEPPLATMSIGDDLESSKVDTLKALGLEAKQVIASKTIDNLEASSSRESEVKGADKLKTAAKCKYLLPPKGRRGLIKGLKAKKVTLSVTTKNLEAERTEVVLEPNQSSTDKETKQVDAALAKNNLEASKPEEIRIDDLEATKLTVAATKHTITLSKSKRSGPKGLVTKKASPATVAVDLELPKPIDAGLQQPAAPTELKNLKPPQSKTVKAKGLEAKKVKDSVAIAESHSTKSKTVKAKGSKAKKISDSVPRAETHSSKSKMVKGLKAKKVTLSVTTKNLETEVKDLGADKLKTAARCKYLLPPKGRRGLTTGLKAKKTTLSMTTKNLEVERTEVVLESKKSFTDKEAVQSSKFVSGLDVETKQVDATLVKAKSSEANEKNDSVSVAESVAVAESHSSKSKTVKAKDSEAKKVNGSVATAESHSSKSKTVKAKDSEAKKINDSVPTSESHSSRSKTVKAKDSEAKKISDSVPTSESHSSKSKTVKAKDSKAKKVIGSAATSESNSFKSKMVKAKESEAKKVNGSVATTHSSKSKKTEKKVLQDKQQAAAVEIIDLDAPNVKRSKGRGSEARKANIFDAAKGSKLARPKETGNRGVGAKQLVVSNQISLPQRKESVGTVLQAQQNDVAVEIISVQSPSLQIDRGASNTETVLTATKSQPQIIIDTIDLDPPIPKKKRQRLDVNNGLARTQDLDQPKDEEIKIVNEGNKNVEPSQQKGFDGKTVRTSGSTEFKFPKPKRVKAVRVKRVSAFVPAKSEAIEVKSVEQKQDASVGTKDFEPPKLKEAEISSSPMKPMTCTVATQTIEIPDDILEDIPQAPEVKSSERKTSVSSVGTQVLESPKLKAVEDKDLRRTTSVSAVEIIDLEGPSSRKNINSSMGKDACETSLPRGGKTSESGPKNNLNDDEIVKIEEDNLTSSIQPGFTINTLEESQEIGVKYEALDQIHTEFKYESQSETEQMMKKRRGKHGGPMRGKRRGFKKTEGQTTIDSFFRIVDLNGKIQMKCRAQIFKCDHCLYVGNSKANLERHSLIHRNPDEIMWFHCTECPYKSKYEHQLKSHFLIHMNPDQIQFFQCPHCEVKCSRKHNLTNHIKSIHADREYSFKCAECKYSTFSKDRLVAHIKKHSKEVHACTLCKFVTKRLEYLESHFKMKHMEEVPRPFPCDTCSYKGKTKRELDKHYDRMHNKEQLHVYQCNHCSFNSIYKKNLEFHLLHMHNNSEGFQKFICGHCQKSFSYKNGLKVHIIRCHIKLPDDDWHKCLECKYKSKDVSTLKRHIKRNHGAPRLHCKQCSFATNRQTSMEAHIKTHEYDNEDILKCPECPYRIIQMSSFLYHMKVIHGKPITSKEADQYYMQDE